MVLVKVTRNYQITIPSEVRKRLNIKKGEYLRVEIKGDKIVLTKASREWRTVRLGKKLTIEEIEKSIERGINSKISNHI